MKTNFNKGGFTLIELLISLVIIAIIGATAIPVYYHFYTRNELDAVVGNTVQKIRRAQTLALTMTEDDSWGVAIKNESILLFKGEIYEENSSIVLEEFLIPNNILFSGLEEVVFEKNTGLPKTSGEIKFSTRDELSRSIIINEMGVLSYGESELLEEEPVTDFCGGDGSIENPYLICNAYHLNNIREELDLNYKLNNNINLNIDPYNSGEGWRPIGSQANPFTGVLDGDGKTISNLYINRPDEIYNGLFGYITATPAKEAGVYNLGLINVNIIGGDYTGGIAGHIGGVWNADGKISNSFVKGTIKGGGSTGGVAGYTAYKSYLSNVYSVSNIEGGWGAGGISGSHWGSNNVIINSYSASQITPGGGVGGVIGQGNSSVINTYWDKDLFPTSPNGEGKTTAEMKDINTFSDWNISTSSINLNDGYPYLAWEEGVTDYHWLIYE